MHGLLALLLLHQCSALRVASVVLRGGRASNSRIAHCRMGVADLSYDDGLETYRAADMCCYDDDCESVAASDRDDCEVTGPFTYVTDASFEELVLRQSSTSPVLLAVGATWCGHCKVILPLLRELNSQGDVIVVKIMLSDDSKSFQKVVQYLDNHGHKVVALPACVLFFGGEPIDVLVGRKGRSDQTNDPYDDPDRCTDDPPASISRPAGFHAKQLNFFLEKQPALAALVREWKSRPQAPVPLGAAEPYVESGFERIEQLDPRIQARIRAAAEASTASRKFG